MLDVKKRIWSKTILDKFNIPKEYLPTLFESSAKVGNMRSSLINKFGLETKVEILQVELIMLVRLLELG